MDLTERFSRCKEEEIVAKRADRILVRATCRFEVCKETPIIRGFVVGNWTVPSQTDGLQVHEGQIRRFHAIEFLMYGDVP